jgi:hypothetical protein
MQYSELDCVLMQHSINLVYFIHFNSYMNINFLDFTFSFSLQLM